MTNNLEKISIVLLVLTACIVASVSTVGGIKYTDISAALNDNAYVASDVQTAQDVAYKNGVADGAKLFDSFIHIGDKVIGLYIDKEALNLEALDWTQSQLHPFFGEFIILAMSEQGNLNLIAARKKVEDDYKYALFLNGSTPIYLQNGYYFVEDSTEDSTEDYWDLDDNNFASIPYASEDGEIIASVLQQKYWYKWCSKTAFED